MAVIAQWLTKKWEVSTSKIMALEGLSTSFKLQAENNTDAEGKSPTNVRGLDLQSLSFETFISDTVGIDVRPEIESWGALVGRSAPFVLAGQRFGPAKLQLTDVGVSDIIIDDFGRIRQAKISMNFQEEAPEANKDKPQTAQSGSVSPTAINVGASSDDKAAKKPVNL